MSVSRQVTIGLVQIDLELGDIPTNVIKIEKSIREAVAKGAQIICLPELCTTGYRQDLLQERFWEVAESIPGTTTDKFCRLAKELGVYIILPMNEKGKMTGIQYNSAAFIDKTGQVQGVFRKVHAFSTECYYFTEGNEYPVFDTEYGKVGIMIGYDMGFPEVARILTLKGAEIIFVSSALQKEAEDIWDISISARAIENQVFLAAVNRVGSEGDMVMHGKSKIVDAGGKILAEALRFEEDIAISTIDLDDLIITRRLIPYLKDRKPTTYGLITDIDYT